MRSSLPVGSPTVTSLVRRRRGEKAALHSPRHYGVCAFTGISVRSPERRRLLPLLYPVAEERRTSRRCEGSVTFGVPRHACTFSLYSVDRILSARSPWNFTLVFHSVSSHIMAVDAKAVGRVIFVISFPLSLLWASVHWTRRRACFSSAALRLKISFTRRTWRPFTSGTDAGCPVLGRRTRKQKPGISRDALLLCHLSPLSCDGCAAGMVSPGLHSSERS